MTISVAIAAYTKSSLSAYVHCLNFSFYFVTGGKNFKVGLVHTGTATTYFDVVMKWVLCAIVAEMGFSLNGAELSLNSVNSQIQRICETTEACIGFNF